MQLQLKLDNWENFIAKSQENQIFVIVFNLFACKLI